MYSSVRAAMSSSRGATRYRHPTNGRAIRRSPAGPLDLMRSAPVEAACSRLPAVFQKENTILTDSVSFVTGCRFCCPHPYTSQGRGSVRGNPLRVSPLAFSRPPAGDHFCVAKVLLQKRKTPMWVSFFFGAGDEARLATGIPRMAEPFAGALPDLLIQRASRRSRQRVQACPRHSKKKTPS